MTNHAGLLENSNINNLAHNVLMSTVVFVTILLGVRNLIKAATNISGVAAVEEYWVLGFAVLVSLVVFWPLYRRIKKLRIAGQGVETRN